LLAGVLIGAIILIGYVTVGRYIPRLISKISASRGQNDSQTDATETEPAELATQEEDAAQPAQEEAVPAKKPVRRSGEPVDLSLGVYRSMGSLRQAQRKAESLGLVTEYSKKEEEQSVWSVGTGASGAREDADRKASGIRSLGIPASVSGGASGRYGISCGSFPSEEAAQKRAIALKASGYGGHVSQSKRKQVTYSLRVKNIPADKADEIIGKLKEMGLRVREL